MKSKFRTFTTLFLVLILVLFGFLLYNELKIDKTSKIISANDSLFGANDASLAELTVYDIATASDPKLVKSFSDAEIGASSSYSVNVDYNVSEVKIRGVANDGYATLVGNGTKNLKAGANTVTLTITSSNGENTNTYTLTINRASFPSGNHSTLLYSLHVGETETVYVNPRIKNYTVTIPSGWYYLTPYYETYDSDATVTPEAGCFDYVPETKVCTITVTDSAASPSETVYNITLFKKDASTSTDYNYVGYTQSYTAPYTGHYKLEAWGAQGGSDGSIGGYGGYSTGIMHLNKGDKIYVTVGGRGADCITAGGGGYNGGGKAGNYGCSGAGGGATHFAFTSGTLASKENPMDPTSSLGSTWDGYTFVHPDIIMVAGGGGGAGYRSSGGSGGGYWGNAGSSEDGGGYGSQGNGGAGTDAGDFGAGGNRINGDGGGGGAGWYGGGAGKGDVGGGGGSGYIGNASLISIYGYTKHMTCYHCSTLDVNPNILTYSTSAVNTNPVSDQAKRGNGFAAVSYLDLSENKYLTTLRVLDPTSKKLIEFDGPTEFAYNVKNYDVTLDSEQTRITIRATSTDPKLRITGDIGDEIQVPAGNHTFNITATSEYGTFTLYTITTHREPSHSVYVHQILINGLLEKYCSLDFDANQNKVYNDDHDYLNFCQLYPQLTNMNYIGSAANTKDSAPTGIAWDPTVHHYDLVVQQRIKEIQFEVVKDNENQDVTGVGEIGGTADVTQLKPGDNPITIDVVSEYCALYEEEHLTYPPGETCTNGYEFNIYRDYYHDADLADLKITSTEHFVDDDGVLQGFDLNFTDPAVLDYYFSVPNSWTYVKDLVAEADIVGYPPIPDATVQILDNAEGTFATPGKTYIVTIRVTAPDGTTQQDYKLHVYRSLNKNIYLESLKYFNKDVVEVPITPAFNKKITDYEVVVPTNNAIGYIRFKPAQTTSTVSLYKGSSPSNSIDITPNSDFEYFAELKLNRGLNYFTIKVRAQNGDEGYYYLTVNRLLSNDSSISGIIAKTNTKYWTLTPSFDPGQYHYDIEVDPGTRFVDLIPITNDENATYETLEGKYITYTSTNLGYNEKTLRITSEDGTTYTEYTFTIHRPPYTDSALYGISVTSSDQEDATVYPITPVFDSATFEYTLNVPNSVTNVWIWYNTNDHFQNVETNYSNGSSGVSLHTGANVFTFKSTAEDGSSTTNYKLTIYREINTNVTLQDLSIRFYDQHNNGFDGTINETITSYTTDYTSTAPYYARKAVLTVTPSVGTVNVVPESPWTNLNYGPNVITFKLQTDESPPLYEQDYTVTVTRVFNPDCGLSYLTLEDEWGNFHELTPTFDPMVLNYTANVSNKSDSVRIHAGSKSSTAKITGTGWHTLNYGPNTYKVTVSNYDTNTKTTYSEEYTLVVTRDPSSDPCPEEIYLYYPSSGYGDSILWSKRITGSCENEEFNITVRSPDKLFVRVESPYRVIQHVVYSGVTYSGSNLPESYTKGGPTVTFDVTIFSQDYNYSVTYRFNVTYPEYVGSNYLSNLQVKNGDTEYDVKQASNTTLNFDKNVADYKVMVTIPYNVPTVNIIATPEDPKARINGAGYKNVPTNRNDDIPGATSGADNVFTIVVTPASDVDDQTTRTYTIIINREHGHEARLSALSAYYNSPFPDVVASVDNYKFYDSSALTTEKAFDQDTFSGYHMRIDSYADHPLGAKNFHYTKVDPNATANFPNLPMPAPLTEYEYTITVYAEDGLEATKKTYTINVSRLEGTIAYLSGLCLYNDTTERCESLYPAPQSGDLWESISFHPNTELYYAYVDSSFDKNHDVDNKELNVDNVIFTLFDGAATVTRTNPTVKLVRDNFVEYEIKVDSEDGKSHKTYKLRVMLVLGSDPRIKTVSIPSGFLLNKDAYYLGYNPEDTTNTEYYWIIPDANYPNYSDSSLSYTLFDSKASSVKSYDSTNKIITVVTTSEDGKNSLTYKFIMKKYSDVNVAAKNLRIYDANIKDPDDDTLPFEYPYEPDLTDFVFEYTTHVYDNSTALNITLKMKDSGCTITGPTNPIPLSGTSQDITYYVTSPDGTFTVPYIIHVIRDILSEKNASDLYLIDEGSENGPICKGQQCILEPLFSPTRKGYTTTIPYEYDHMYFYVGLNEQQTARFFVDNPTNKEVYNRTYREAENEGQDLINEGYAIPLGESEVKILIYDGLGVQTQNYLVQFNRKKSSDATLSDLKVKKTDGSEAYWSLDHLFDPEDYLYSVFVPSGTESVEIEYEKSNPYAEVSIQGETGLKDGINKVLISVLAQDEETMKTYTVYVNVGVDYRSLLSNITVSTGLQFYELTPEFYKSETEYFVIVPSSTTQVIVEGTVENPSTIVMGNNSYEVSTGYNYFTLKGQYYEGDEKLSETEYHVTIYRRYPNNVRLSSLVVRDINWPYQEYALSPEFDTGTTNYSVAVPAGTTSLRISATPEYPESTVNIVGNANFKSGFNIVNVYVISADGNLTKTYQLSVFVRPSNDASLGMIDVYSSPSKTVRLGVKNFSSTVYEYDMEVPATQDSVFIVGVPNVSSASVAGGGYNALQYGDNKIELLVTAEDGETHTKYTVNIYRNYNLLLKELSHNLETDYPLTPAFDPYVNEYRIEVPFDTKSIKLNAVAEAGSAVNLAYNQVNYLEIGENTLSITLTDKKGNRNVYTIVVDRVGSANNYLAALVPSQGMLTEDFARDIQNYTLLLPNNLKFLDITDWIITPESEYATYEISGYESINPNATGQQIKIVVTAQNGAKRTYTLALEFLPPEYFNHYLSALWLDNDLTGTDLRTFPLSPKYDMEVGSYTATLPYGVDQATIHAVPINTTDKVYISGTWTNDPSLPDEDKNEKHVSLNFGRNVFKIKVDGGTAGYKIYTLIIYRTSSPDPTLASLTVEDYSYTPIFNKRLFDYYVTVPTSVTSLDVTYIPSDPASTVVIKGNTGLNPTAINVIEVEVTAPDGITKQSYYIHVTMEADKDNYLDDLIVQGYSLTPLFTKTNTGAYEVKVETTVSKVLVYADASSPTAYVNIDDGSNTFSGIDIVSGAISVKPGNNYVQVSVTADSGDVRVYTVNIFKEYKTISSLKALYTEYSDGVTGYSISQDGYTPAFSPTTLVYYETVPYNVNGVYTVIGFKTDADSTLVSTGTTKLKEGLNEIKVEVTAEDGVTKSTYIIYVNMEKGPSTKLEKLSISEGALDPKFDKDTTHYYVEVPSEVTSLDFKDLTNPNGKDLYVPEDPNAIITVSGNSSFAQNSISNVTITVKCGGTATECASVNDTTYTIEVYRSIVGDDKLDQLYIKNYPFTPTFAPLTLQYTREVENSVDKVTVGAFRTNSDAKIYINDVLKSGTGGEEEINLKVGENIVYVKVVASNGAKRTYQIVINRKDTGNFLTRLETNAGSWTLTPTEALLQTQFDYELFLPDGVTQITLTGEWSDGATATNITTTGTKVQVPVGSNLVYKITVTSASGESNIYNVTIHGAKTANTGIKLNTNHGEPDYVGDNKYELTVQDDVSTIELIVTPDDEGATVIKQPFYAVQYGETVIKFQVKSSDGTKTEEYTLTVTRGKDIEKIIPDKAEIVIVVDEEETITYKIQPADATSTNVKFVTKDATIASVDTDGKVKGLSKGKTIVEIQSVKDPAIKGEVSVYVLDKRISSDTYHVAHKDETDNPYNLYDLDYVFGNEPKVKINEYLDNFSNPATYLHVYENGTEITDLTRFVGSAMVLKLEIGGTVYDEIAIIVKGDIGTYDSPGNGLVTASDANIFSQTVSGLTVADNLLKAEMDLDSNKYVTASDAATVNSFVSGLKAKIID